MSEKNTPNKIRVLLAESPTAEHYQNEHALNRCENIELLPNVSDGRQVLTILKKEEVDLLLLDLLVSNIDGIMVLRELSRMTLKKRPVIILLSAVCSELVISEAMNLGVAYPLKKPLDPNTMVQRSLEVYYNVIQGGSSSSKKFSTPELRSISSALLREVGVAPHLLGYQYLLSAINISVQSGGFHHGITTLIYPKVAETYHSTPQKVERSIRHALETAWSSGSADRFQALFDVPGIERKRPTNSEFIARCTEIVIDRLRYEQNEYITAVNTMTDILS